MAGTVAAVVVSSDFRCCCPYCESGIRPTRARVLGEFAALIRELSSFGITGDAAVDGCMSVRWQHKLGHLIPAGECPCCNRDMATGSGNAWDDFLGICYECRLCMAHQSPSCMVVQQ